jgi:hypothetical protein
VVQAQAQVARKAESGKQKLQKQPAPAAVHTCWLEVKLEASREKEKA